MESNQGSRAEQLVRRAQSGDRGAFGELLESYRAKLLAWLESRAGAQLRGRVEAEDLLQETMLWAQRSMPRLEWRGEKAFESWLFTIAKHVLLKEARHGERHPLGVLEREPANDEPSPSRRLRRDERFDRLGRALESLSADHREVIELARLRGLSVAEIARRMKRSPNATSQLLGRALAKLREALGDTESLGMPAARSLGVRSSATERDGDANSGEEGRRDA